MHWTSIIFWTASVAIVLAFEAARRRRLLPILNRPCSGRQWRRTFPNASKSDIRDFLDLFLASFALNPKDRLAFTPTDRIFDVYRLVAPKWQGFDSLELESLEELLQNRYGLDLRAIWRQDLTLGEVFGRTQVGEPPAAADRARGRGKSG
ncbi:MAG: hypothetical protein ACTHM6_05920 [Tepidisphaeraceae bacterium]